MAETLGWASYLSRKSELEWAIDEAIRGCYKTEAGEGFGLKPDMPAHLAVVFVSSAHADRYKVTSSASQNALQAHVGTACRQPFVNRKIE